MKAIHSILTALALCGVIFATAAADVRAQSVIFSEVSSDNEMLSDEDEQEPDWVELMNVSSSTVDLDRWHLTDDSGDLTQWTFPAVSLTPGELLVVFCSGKDRTDPAADLHTNFKLDADGEYLALVQSDGATIEDEFADGLPEQPTDVTYGRAFGDEATLVASGATGLLHIPSDSSLGATWTAQDFTASSPGWVEVQTPVGFSATPGLTAAGEIFVNLDATTLPLGSLETWTNGGTTGTEFTYIDSTPTVEDIQGVRCVSFDGDDAMSLDAVAPEGMSGTESWTIEVWAYNSEIGDEETMISCWHRAANGSGSFFWGANETWGAFGAWDNDMPYSEVPQANQWHHLVLTNEGGLGGNICVYVDGELDNSRTMAVSMRDYDEAMAIMLGWSSTDTGVEVEANSGDSFTGALARVRIYDDEMTPAQVRNNYDAETKLFDGSQIAALETGDGLLVDLDAGDASAGEATWINNGTLGDFTEIGNDAIKETIDGVPAVTFDGSTGYEGPDAPNSITRASDRCAEVWVYNPTSPAIKDEETMISWAKRGSNLQHQVFNYGSNSSYGAIANWSDGDMPWYDNGGAPQTGVWHHLALTYNNNTMTVYEDGVAVNSENMWLNTYTGYPIILGTQCDSDGNIEYNANRTATLSMSRIRVHSGVLSEEQLMSNYLFERNEFITEPSTDFGSDLESSMYGVQPGAYLIVPFTIAGDPAELYSYLLLRMRYDDGFVAYINGTEVARRNAPAPVAFDSTATDSTGDLDEIEVESIAISEYIDLLQTGENILAIHGLNVSAGDFDFLIDPELIAMSFSLTPSWYLSEPTPGEFNTHHVPGILNVKHDPGQPASAETCIVEADVSDPNGIASVTLNYQVVSPGAYITAYLPLDHDTLQYAPETENEVNPGYIDPANWTSVTMYDDGTNGDEEAGDGEYAATLPVQDNRTLVRYTITAVNGVGVEATAPYPLDPNLNFAYYVYDGVPSYTVSDSVEFGDAHTYSAETMESLPIYQLITRAEDIEESHAWDSSDQLTCNSTNSTCIAARRRENWFGTFVYDGKVYDNISYRLRGTNARYLLDGKRSLKIKFNAGNYFQARDIYGNKYPTKWRRLLVGKMFSNLQGWWPSWGGDDERTPYSDFGLTEMVSNKLFNLYDVPAPYTHWFHFRVVDGSEEAPSDGNGQYYGDFWGMFLALEEYDKNFLESHGLDEGNLYKLSGFVYDGTEQLHYHSPDAVDDAADYENIRWNFYSPAQTETFLKTYCNYDEWYRYHAITDAIKHWDVFPGPTDSSGMKNLVWYFEPSETNDYGQCWFLPFDLDSTWGPTFNEGLDQGKYAIYEATGHTGMQLEYRNTMREMRDLLFNEEVVKPMLDEYAAMIADFVPADRDRWENHPDTPYYSGPLADKVDDMKAFAFEGGSWAYYDDPFKGVVQTGGQASYVDDLCDEGNDDTNTPNTPTVTYTGGDGYPANNLLFTSSDFSDPQGTGDFQTLKWRMGEITDPDCPAYDEDDEPIFEVTEVWSSGELTSNDAIQIPSGTAVPGHTYRVRVRHQDGTGRWSHWSGALEFTAGDPDTAVDLESYLRISELMYDPSAGTDYEFIELHNVSDSTAIEFNGETFTSGIEYTIPIGTQIAPDGYLVITKNESTDFADFITEYGLDSSVSILGPYSGKLSNNGERIELSRTSDAKSLLDFEYSDGRGWRLQADGPGHSLVPVDMNSQTSDSLNFCGNWRPSAYFGGSPGAADPDLDRTVILTEVSPHTDTGLAAPADSNDWFEILNVTATAVSLTDWYASDDKDDLTKYELAGGYASIGANGRLSFEENTHFNNPAGDGFGLNKAGEELFLSYLPSGDEASWRVVDVARFKGVENETESSNTTWGRTPDQGEWWKLTTTSRDAGNGDARLDAIISEFMYHPLDDEALGEYIEIWNPTDTAIDLYVTGAGAWRINGGVDYIFPNSETIDAGERILIVNFDPTVAADMTAFETIYGEISGDVYGPFLDGVLSNEGERIALERPQPEDEAGEGISWVIADEVIYFDQYPWTEKADGDGLSLQRIDEGVPGRDWDNWEAVTPSPNYYLTNPEADITSGDVAEGGSTGAYPVSFTVTFSEAVDGFTEDDIVLTNATLKTGTFSGANGDTVFTFDILPVETGPVSIVIAAGAVQSTAYGSDSLEAVSFSFDATVNDPPTFVIDSPDVDDGDDTIETAIDMLITFSEAVTGFEESDIALTNATTQPGSFGEEVADTIFEFTVVPAAAGEVTVTVPASAAQSTAHGLYNQDSDDYSFTYVIPEALTVAVTSTVVDPGENTASTPVRIAVTFSEAVNGFTTDDVSMTNATLDESTFTGADGSSIFMFYITPDSYGAVSVTVSALCAETTAYGVTNLEAASFSFVSIPADSSVSAPWVLFR